MKRPETAYIIRPQNQHLLALTRNLRTGLALLCIATLAFVAGNCEPLCADCRACQAPVPKPVHISQPNGLRRILGRPTNPYDWNLYAIERRDNGDCLTYFVTLWQSHWRK